MIRRSFMNITWYGHACFLLDTACGSAVFDPYDPEMLPGLHLEKIFADAVFCSHSHGDHNYTDAVTLTGKQPSFTVQELASWHDDRQGALRGENRITILEAEGLKVVHMGDIGHLLSEELAAQIGKPDILMIPVGGYYTVDAAAAKAICCQLSPRVILPMHYRLGKRGLQNIAPVDEFLRLFPKEEVTFLPSSTASVEELKTKVAVFQY